MAVLHVQLRSNSSSPDVIKRMIKFFVPYAQLVHFKSGGGGKPAMQQ